MKEEWNDYNLDNPIDIPTEEFTVPKYLFVCCGFLSVFIGISVYLLW